MKLVYCAGPFRNPSRWYVIQNIRRAEQVALDVGKLGAMPVCPHTNTGNFDGELGDEFMLEGTLELMRRCDAVVLVPGWERSAGTRGEIDEARRLGIPVFHTLWDLREWLTPRSSSDT